VSLLDAFVLGFTAGALAWPLGVLLFWWRTGAFRAPQPKA
jgi:hypothetical protein